MHRSRGSWSRLRIRCQSLPELVLGGASDTVRLEMFCLLKGWRTGKRSFVWAAVTVTVTQGRAAAKVLEVIWRSLLKQLSQLL
mmetsp:Transcript_35445/g.63992  ORF Transcript_35445/g.63992 Transcript_35445/m.63992 type:complete len:83 (-) Transcript_35445:187-435(-)